MTRGDLVTYRERPQWGAGIVEWIGAGRVSASFETPEGPYTDEFAEGELEPASQVKAAV